MTWKNAAKRVEAGIATMLAWAAGGGVTAEEMLKAADEVAADMAEMVALANVECASNEDLHDMAQTCRAISAKLAVFDERAQAILAMMRNERNGDAAVA